MAPNGDQSCNAALLSLSMGTKAAMLHPQGSLWGSKLHCCSFEPLYGVQSCSTSFLWLSMGFKATLLHPQDPQWGTRAAMLLSYGSPWRSNLQCCFLMAPNGDQSCSTSFLWLSIGTKAAMLHPHDPQWASKLHCCTLMTPNEAPKPAPPLSTPPCSQDPHHHPCQPNPDPTPPPTTPSPPTHLLLLPLHPWSPR